MKRFSYIPTLHLIGQLGRILKPGLDYVIYCGFQINQTAHIAIEDEKVVLSPTYLHDQSVAMMDVRIKSTS